jgi:hypothetical protein
VRTREDMYIAAKSDHGVAGPFPPILESSAEHRPQRHTSSHRTLTATSGHAANRSGSAGDDEVGHVGYWLVAEGGVDLV